LENRNGAIAIPNTGSRLWGYWQNPAIRTTLQVLLLLGIGALASAGKALSPSLGISGSSAPLWLTPLILGRLLVRRSGAGTLMGVSVAVWGIPFGINNGFMHNLALYGYTGLALDIVAKIPKLNITTWYGAIICGGLAHMVKFGYIFSASFFSPATKRFIISGLAQSAGQHLAFGIASGIVAWGIYRGIKSLRPRKPEVKSNEIRTLE
jgi:hypothetical protein